MSDDAQDELPVGTVIDGRYTVEGLLGRGGMAAVYRVRHNSLDTQHALKILSVGGASLTRRLQQEGKVQASLAHPNIVAVTDTAVVDGAPGLVMEFVRGPNLETLLEARRPNLDQIDALAIGIMDGVAAAHALNLIHRDLKPANVMIAVTQSGLVPKVADFGLVKLIASEEGGSFSKTRSGMAMGTPAYMAPEQIEDAKGVDARADIWSLGAILYEIASGQRAFEGANVLSLFMKVATGDRKPIRDICPELPDRMVDAIEAALSVDRAGRIADVRTLRKRWLQGAVLPTESPWTDDWLELASSLGAKADSTKDFIERSFRSGANQAFVRNQASPVAVRPDAATLLGNNAAGPTAVPVVGTTTVPDDASTSVPPTTVPPGARPPDPTAATVIRPALASEAPATGGSGAAPFVVAGLGLAPLIVLGAALVGFVGVGIGWFATHQPAARPIETPDPVPVVAPDPAPEPLPEPGPGPRPVDPRPQPNPQPAGPRPQPEPQPPGPQPEPAPPQPGPQPQPEPAQPEPRPEPAPQPDPAPQPAPAATAIRLDGGGASVNLLDETGRRVSAGALAPGRYVVRAFFDPKDPEKGTDFAFVLSPGQTLSIKCIPTRFKCLPQ
jgi:serine/threonine protein kinase